MSQSVESQYVKVLKEECDEIEDIPTSYGYGVRHIQIFLTFLCFTIVFQSRSHIGITVVAMTKTPNVNNNVTNSLDPISESAGNRTDWKNLDSYNIAMAKDFRENNESYIQPSPANLEDDGEKLGMTYDWPKSVQEMVIGSFFFGYTIMMFPMGMVGQKWGGKLPIQIALLVNGLTSIGTPWLVKWGGWKAVCACRILQGLSQAGLYPSMQIIVAKWSHPSERGKFISFVFTGGTLATIIAFQVGGVLASSRWGWPSIFWCSGILCLLMLIIFTVFGSASPNEHKSICKREKMYIIGKSDGSLKKKRVVPWRAILKSRPIWATVATHVGSLFAYTFFLNQVPSYIRYVLKMNIKNSGILSSLPHAASLVTNIAFGYLSDFLTNRKILSIANSRRLFNSISQIGIAVSFTVISYTESVEMAVGFMILSMSFKSAIYTGWLVNHIDLAPNFTGSLMAFGNTISCVILLFMPVFVSYTVTDVTSQLQWRTLFISMAVLTFVTNAIFVVFMSSDTQPWNDYGYEQTEDADENTKKTGDQDKSRVLL